MVRTPCTGLLPLLAAVHEPDLVVQFLPRLPGLPFLEKFDRITHGAKDRFAPNDWMVHAMVTPFGPFPGGAMPSQQPPHALLSGCMPPRALARPGGGSARCQEGGAQRQKTVRDLGLIDR